MDRAFAIPLLLVLFGIVVLAIQSILPGELPRDRLTSAAETTSPQPPSDPGLRALATEVGQLRAVVEQVYLKGPENAVAEDSVTDDVEDSQSAPIGPFDKYRPSDDEAGFNPGSSAGTVAETAGPISLVIAVLVFAAYWLAQTVFADSPVTDSREFADAVGRWLPLLEFETDNNPRALKRYLNRVRYLSMRMQGDRNPDPTRWERFVEWLVSRGRVTPSDKTGSDRPPAIPDRVLVALSALELRNPRWIASEGALTATSDPESPDADSVIRSNSRLQSELPTLAAYLPQYRAISGQLADH